MEGGIVSASCTVARAEARAAVPAVAFLANVLAAKMLNSYLNGNITAATISEIVAAVQRHSTHASIVDWVHRKVQEHVDDVGLLPDNLALRDLCDDAIATFQMASPAAAAAEAPSSLGGRAYFSGDLQAVIGGINDMILVDAVTDEQRRRRTSVQRLLCNSRYI
jgi:hypothetical protein